MGLPTGRISGAFYTSLLVLGALALVDWGVRTSADERGLFDDPVDLQSSSALYAKAMFLREHAADRFVVLGDSTVLGGEMGEYGDADWRKHSIDKVIAAQSGVATMNFALNGALPSDLERVAKAIVPFRPRLLLLGLHLQSFSPQEGEGGKRRYSRPWLRSLRITESGGLKSDSSAGMASPAWLDAQVDSFLVRYWFTYRIRDLWQWRRLGGPPAELVRRSVKRLAAVLRRAPPDDPAAELERTLEKSRRRYSQVDLSERNAEVGALRSLLEFLRREKQPTVVFYIPENPALLAAMMPGEQYRRERARLKDIVSEYVSSGLSAVLDPVAAPAGGYDDDIHLNAAGYEFYVRANLASSWR